MQRTPPELTENARRLRREATAEERILWAVLREHRPRFTRQYVVDRYIVDSACRSMRIAVELDGGHHAIRTDEYSSRGNHLARHGWVVLRFWNNEIRDHLPAVVETIMAAVSQASTHPQPLPCREGS